MITEGKTEAIAKQIGYLNELKADIECMARRKEAITVRELRSNWSIEKELEASERFDIQMLYTPFMGTVAYPQFREEYKEQRQKDLRPPEAVLFFDIFISEYYLGKRELDYLEEAFSELNAHKPIGCKHYEDLCLKIALLERELFSYMDAYLNNNPPETKDILPTRNIAHKTGEVHCLPDKRSKFTIAITENDFNRQEG